MHSLLERTSLACHRAQRMPSHRAWGVFCLILVSILGTSCSSNKCQTLCDVYYEMSLRCDLFGARSGQQPETCLREDSDPQVLQQRADYALRQCRQDFREVSCGELKRCCTAGCFQSLVTEFDAITTTREQDYEMQREICLKFQQLAETGEAAWCTASQTSCISEWCTTAQSDCPDLAAAEPSCSSPSP